VIRRTARVRAAAVCAACVTAALGTVAAPPSAAWARDTIVASIPADFSALQTGPTEIDLTGSTRPDPSLSHISLWDGDGNSVAADAEPGVRGNVLWCPVRITSTGNFSIAYHVVFANGDDTIGVVHFSVGTGVPPPVPPAAVTRAETEAAATHQHSGVDPIGGTLLVVDVVVLAGVLILLLIKPRPRPLAHPVDKN
jgi:methionine-rich copper-binding protein CopC